MTEEDYPDSRIRAILSKVKRIAMVGASANSARPAYLVLKYLSERGYTMLPVNPGMGSGKINGIGVFASLAETPGPIDMVDIFRRPEAVAGVVDEALALDPLPQVIWMQLGVRDQVAAARARARGVEVIQNRCPKIEYGRLSGEIGWHGVNSRIISARKTRAGAGFQRLDL